jgi:hypothetical protein
MDTDGSVHFSQEIEIALSAIPSVFDLKQNYPNPFNPSTTISFNVPQGEHVLLRVFTMLGQEVATLVNERREAGSYSVQFSANNLAAGQYFYRIKAGEFVDVKRMTLIK